MLERKRLHNIHRILEFERDLFGSKSLVEIFDHDTSRKDECALEEEPRTAPENLIQSCMFREHLFSSLWNFCFSHRRDPFLIHGCSGSGKTYVLKQLNANKKNSTIISCLGFSSYKQFFGYLCAKLMIALGIKKISEKKSILGFVKQQFDIELLFVKIEEYIPHSNEHFILMLDNVESLETLQPGIWNQIVLCSEKLNSRIKIIGATKNRIASATFFTFFLKPYSDLEIRSILNEMIEDKFLDIYPTLGKQDKAAYILAMKNFVRDNLASLLIRTRHIADIWSALVKIWSECSNQESSVDSITRKSVLSRLRFPSWDMSLQNMTSFISFEEKSVPQIKSMNETCSMAIELNSLRCSDWLKSLCDNDKILIVASYLASLIPAERDAYQFGGMREAKRIKKIDSSDGSTSHSLDSAYAINQNQNVVKMERILSIFVTIFSTTGLSSVGLTKLGKKDELRDPRNVIQLVNKQFGDAFLFSSICSMENIGLLMRASSWTIDSPSYTVHISRSMALDISSSIDFPLQEHLSRL